MAKILNLKENVSIVPCIIDAVANGFRDDMILDELADAVENKSITRQQFESAIEALNLYSMRFIDTIKNIAEVMKKFEFNDELPVLRNRRLNLAEQVMNDITGFNEAVDEFDGEAKENGEKDGNVDVKLSEEKISDIKKPASYKDYFISKLKQFKVNNPVSLTPEQWNEIEKGWTSKEEAKV